MILVGAFVGAAAGYVGSLMVLKRMSLVGDALSHVALPGMAIAIIFNISPIVGAFIALMAAVFGVWYLEKSSRLYPETLVGLFFTTSLAIGVLITPQPELLEALFGNIEKVTRVEGLVAIGVSVLILLATWFISQKFILGVISEELAQSIGIPTKILELVYLVIIGTVVALGIKFVGTMLMGALVIIPAASAKNISRGLGDYFLLSIIIGAFSAILGVAVANLYKAESGPIVVLVSAVFFVLSLIIKFILKRSTIKV